LEWKSDFYVIFQGHQKLFFDCMVEKGYLKRAASSTCNAYCGFISIYMIYKFRTYQE
jgi:hypothetical protein